MQSQDVLDYLRRKYALSREGAVAEYGIFDPWINPDTGYIPVCANCKNYFEDWRIEQEEKCEMEHSSACLWYDYFAAKIRQIKPGTTIILKNVRKKEQTKPTG